MPETYDIAIDFMDMTDDHRLWATRGDVRLGLEPVVGRHVVVGDDDADPRVARIVSVDSDGNVELEVLPGAVEAHLTLVTPA